MAPSVPAMGVVSKRSSRRRCSFTLVLFGQVANQGLPLRARHQPFQEPRSSASVVSGGRVTIVLTVAAGLARTSRDAVHPRPPAPPSAGQWSRAATPATHFTKRLGLAVTMSRASVLARLPTDTLRTVSSHRRSGNDIRNVAQPFVRVPFETSSQQGDEPRRDTGRDSRSIGIALDDGREHVGVVSPENAAAPVSISNTTHPNARMSMRASAALPRACSGLM